MGLFRKGKTEERSLNLITNDDFIQVVSNQLTPRIGLSGFQAIQNSDIRKAVQTIANDVSNCKIDTLVDNKIQRTSEFNYLLNIRPNSIQDAKTFWFAIAASMALNGNAYAEIIRDKEGKVLELQFLPIPDLAVNLDSYGNRIESYTYTGEGKAFTFKPQDILHFKIFSLDGKSGISPLKSLTMEMELLESANKSLLSFYTRAVRGWAKVIVKNNGGGNLNGKSAANIRKQFEELNNPNLDTSKGTVIVEEDKIDYQTIPMDTGFLNLINNITFEQKQIAKVFDIPFEKFGMESINSSSTELNHIYIQTGLKNYLRAIESELAFKLLDNRLGSFKFDTSELTTPNLKERIESLSLGVKSTIFTPNEVRQELGREPIEGGEKLQINTAFAEKGGENVE